MTETTSLGDRVDAETALSVLTACRQDLDVILACIPPSKRGSRLTRALESLDQRIGCGEELREARRG